MRNIYSRKVYKLGGIQAWFIWTLSVSFTIWLHVTQTGYAIFNPDLQNSLNLTIEQIGFAAAVYPCTAAILQLFSGTLMDQLGPRKTILPAIFLATVGVFLFSRADSYAQIVLSQFLFALAACFAFAGSGYITSAWFSKKFWYCLWTRTGYGFLFRCIWSVRLRFFIEEIWMEGDPFFLFPFGAGLFTLSLIFMKRPEEKQKTNFNVKDFSLSILKKNFYVLKQKDVILSSIHGGIVYGFIWALGVVWLPKIILAHGLTVSTANKSSSCLWVGVAVGSLVVNKCLICLKSTKKTLIIFLAVQFVSLVAIVYFELTPITAIIYSLIFGFATSSHMLTYTIGKNAVSKEYAGSAISIVNAFMFLIGGVFVGIIGSFLGNSSQTLHDYQFVASIFWVGMVIAFVSALFFKDEI